MKALVEKAWKDYKIELYNFIKKRINNEEIAKDILQDVFLKINNKISNLKNEDKLESWIFQITRNFIIDHYRTHKDLQDLPEFINSTKKTDIENFRDEIGSWFSHFIDILPDTYKTVIKLFEIEKMIQKEIALKLQLSLPAIKARVLRGREMMKKNLLDCCRFEVDRMGQVIDYESKGKCNNC